MANKPKKLVKARGEVHKARAIENEWKKRFYAMRDQRNLFQKRVDELALALTYSVVAIDDWLNIYASEYCDKDRVKEAYDRTNEHGTLHYIATTQARNHAALEGGESVSVLTKTTEPNEHEK